MRFKLIFLNFDKILVKNAKYITKKFTNIVINFYGEYNNSKAFSNY